MSLVLSTSADPTDPENSPVPHLHSASQLPPVKPPTWESTLSLASHRDSDMHTHTHIRTQTHTQSRERDGAGTNIQLQRFTHTHTCTYTIPHCFPALKAALEVKCLLWPCASSSWYYTLGTPPFAECVCVCFCLWRTVCLYVFVCVCLWRTVCLYVFVSVGVVPHVHLSVQPNSVSFNQVLWRICSL